MMDIYLKRGIATMPVVNPQNFTQYSLEQLALALRATTLSIQPFMDLSSWMLKGSIRHPVSTPR